MTVSIAQVDVNTDKWRDLFEKLNETIYALNNNVASNVGTVSGNVRVGGFISSNRFIEGGNRLVQQTRTIGVEPIWMSGGGDLSSDLNLKFTPRLLAALNKAESALTADDFTGTLGFKTKVQVDDIQAAGVANSSSVLCGDGVWRTHIPAGVMQKSIFDPTNVSKDAFNRAFHHGTAPTSAIAGLDTFIAGAEITSRKGQANGYPGLDATGKIPVTQIPDSVVGTDKFQGDWNANTNTPKIPVASLENKGWYYVTTVAGNTNIDGNNRWLKDDLIISNGIKWSRIIKNQDAYYPPSGFMADPPSGFAAFGVTEISEWEVDEEYNRRVDAGFNFNDQNYDLNLDVLSSAANIATNYPNEEVSMIAKDGVSHTLDAQTIIEMNKVAYETKLNLKLKASHIKKLEPIPVNFRDDEYWIEDINT